MTVDRALDDWARLARGRLSSGYPSQNIIYRCMRLGSQAVAGSFNESYAPHESEWPEHVREVERSLSYMAENIPECWKVIEQIYIYNRTQQHGSSALGISRATFTKRLESAKTAIGMHLGLSLVEMACYG